EWDISDDLKTYTFRLRKDVEFHNGRTVDAEAVKWNLERMMDPATSHAFTRASLEDVESIEVDDKYTVRVRLLQPSAVILGNVRTDDARAVKWHLERMMDPATSQAVARASVEDVESIEVDDQYTVRVRLLQPGAVFLGNVIYYPVNLIAPDSVDEADTHPIGC